MGATMFATVGTVMAGISWEPEIRGALVVLVGGLVLFGSVWLILTTNIGHRLGSLNALAGFFGWMFIMGIVWWIYGIGLRGDDPVWVPEEIVFGELDGAVTGDVGDLGDAVIVHAPELIDEFCPGLVDATVELQRARVVQQDLGIALDEFYTAPEGREYCNEGLGELLAVDTETVADNRRAANEALPDDDPRKLDEAALEEAIEIEIADDLRQASQLSLSAMGSVAPGLIEEAEEEGIVDFAGWNFLSAAEAGEAQATADAFLTSSPDSPFDASADFLVVDAFQKGGKPSRSSDSVVDRVWNEIRNTVLFWHPTNTVVVQVMPTLEKEALPGQPPPFAEIDEEGQIVSVVMVRDLGSRRLPAALTTIGSLVLFLALCWMLHVRDLELRRRLETWDPANAK